MKIILFVFIILINTVGAFGQAVPSEQAEIFPDTFFIRGENDKKEISLTFDDGPDKKNTPKILDILKENNIEVTFFLIGQKVKEYPDITQRIKDEGHQLANHSWSHSNFRYLEDDYILDKEIYPTSEIIEKVTGYYPKVFRPPYGIINNSTVRKLKEKGWKIVNWSIDTYDWLLGSEGIMKIIKDKHHNSGIILMHSSEDSEMTVKVLPEIIEFLNKEEYEFKTINQLFEDI